MKEEISFIAKRYCSGKFSVDKGWKRLDISPVTIWNIRKIAAAVASIVVLSATATVIYHQFTRTEKHEVTIEEIATEAPTMESVKVIDFEDTPLPIVIEQIKEVYGVEVSNLPENADEYHLSLHFEGNAGNLIATINDILETQIEVKE